MTETSRRSLLVGVGALFAAPAIVRAASLMPVKTVRPSWLPDGYLSSEGQTLSRWDYPQLFDALRYAYGGEGSHFRLPDLVGHSLRSGFSPPSHPPLFLPLIAADPHPLAPVGMVTWLSAPPTSRAPLPSAAIRV